MGTKRNGAVMVGALAIALLASVTGCAGKEGASAAPAEALALGESPEPSEAAETPTTTAGRSAGGSAAKPAGKPAASAEATISGTKLRLDILDITRGPGGMATLNFSMTHLDGGSYAGSNLGIHGVTDVYLVDSSARKKYLVVEDDKGICLCTRDPEIIDDGESATSFVKYPPLPDSVKTVSVYVPGFAPIEDVPVS